VNLEGFGVKHLRSLSDTGLVPIRPITLLVGRNSSGKSTFLRAFPLLRQSVETRRDSPILWSHDRYVDFGSFVHASNHALSEPTVTFRFAFPLPKYAEITLEDSTVKLAMTLAGGDVPHVRAYDIEVEDHTIHWKLNAQGRLEQLTVDGEEIHIEGNFALGGKAYLLPTLQKEESRVAFQQAISNAKIDRIDYQSTTADFVDLVEKRIEKLFHKGTKSDNIHDVAWRLALASPDIMLKNLAELSHLAKFKENVKNLDVQHEDFKAIIAASCAYMSPYIIEAADVLLASILGRIVYLKPLRVNPERSYPRQNFAVEEVDPDGGNLAMFLDSLSPEESANFAAFTAKTLGFETKVKSANLRAEILIKEGQSKRDVNLVDVGFGYSEVLPLAATVWATCIRPSMNGKSSTPIVAIEQPELHLHPAAQANLAGMFAEAAKNSQGSKLIIETHSESLINGLGKLIYKGELSANDVQIVLFDKDEETGQTEVSLAGYRDNGALHDWPYGFLSPVGERRVPTSKSE